MTDTPHVGCSPGHGLPPAPAPPPADTVSYKSACRVLKYGADKVAALTLALGREPTGDDFVEHGIEPDEIVERDPGNVALSVGIALLLARWISTGPEKPVWSPSAGGVGACGIGFGDSAITAVPGQTGLVGSSQAYKVMDNGYPQLSGSTSVTLQATFGTGDANFEVNEYCWIGPDTGASTMSGAAVASIPANMQAFNRQAPANLGEKSPTDVWIWQFQMVFE